MSDALIQTALGLHRAGKLEEAVRLYQEILREAPQQPDALYLLGAVHFQGGAYELALTHFERALGARPGFVEALAGSGAALSSLGRHDEALAAYDKVIAANPAHAQSWNNRGNTLLALGRAREAVAGYDSAILIVPGYVEAWRNRAAALLQTGRPDEALHSLEKAVHLKPDFREALEDRANLLAQLGRREEAILAFDRALALDPDNPHLLYNRGNAHAILNRYEGAIRDCEAVLARVPDYPYARGVLVHCKLQSCNWRGLDTDIWNISMALASGKRVVSPFNLKALSGAAAEHLRAARIWMSHEAPPAAKALHQTPSYSHDRIRLAYVSGDFNNSAVATLMAGVFEHHDRAKVEAFALSFGPADPTPMRRRLEGAFERFIDVRGQSDADIAGLLQHLQADIAVDLMGYTGQCRTGIFARRGAPLQVNYLGFPGTMGAPYIDYIIADPTIIPEDQQVHYSERIAYLPHSFLPADRARVRWERAPSRAEAGLPERGFVFASFNAAYKFSPAMFDIWMRLLRNLDESVLWLPENNPLAMRNLAREAEARGVAPARIVFAPLVPDAAEHLARLSLADLFLDTLPYNAHTSASDALWAGLPVLTLAGTSFAGRVAASALKAVGLPDLIAKTPPEYEAIALALARESGALAAIRARLDANRLTARLFDTMAYARDLEAAFSTMWARHSRGESPTSFAVASAG